MKQTKIKFSILFFLISILFFGCYAPVANMIKINHFAPQDNLVILPASAPADISSIATLAVEYRLNASEHRFVSSKKVKEFLFENNLFDEYASFINKQETIGIIDTAFLKRLEPLGNYFMVLKVTAWAKGGNMFSALKDGLTKSRFQVAMESANNRVSSGETLVGLRASVYSLSGDLVYQDENESKLLAPFTPPSFQATAESVALKFGRTLPK